MYVEHSDYKIIQAQISLEVRTVAKLTTFMIGIFGLNLEESCWRTSPSNKLWFNSLRIFIILTIAAWNNKFFNYCFYNPIIVPE